MPMTALDEEIIEYAKKRYARDPTAWFSYGDFIKDTDTDHRDPHYRSKARKRLRNLELYRWLDCMISKDHWGCDMRVYRWKNDDQK